jgi:osmotically inducible protein OsmC
MGGLKNGQGILTTESRVLSKAPYSFHTRFEQGKGTNPEELIAAAHAGCFSMALSHELEQMQLRPQSIQTEALVNLEKNAEGYSVNAVHLRVAASVPGATEEQFQQAAEIAKAGCPISKLLKAKITLETDLLLEVQDRAALELGISS